MDARMNNIDTVMWGRRHKNCAYLCVRNHDCIKRTGLEFRCAQFRFINKSSVWATVCGEGAGKVFWNQEQHGKTLGDGTNTA